MTIYRVHRLVQLTLMGMLAAIVYSPGAIASEPSSSSDGSIPSHPMTDILAATPSLGSLPENSLAKPASNKSDLGESVVGLEPNSDQQTAEEPLGEAPLQTSLQNSLSVSPLTDSPSTDNSTPHLDSFDSIHAIDLMAEANPVSESALTLCSTAEASSSECWDLEVAQLPSDLFSQVDSSEPAEESVETEADPASGEEEAETEAAPDPWRFEFEPYLFIPFSVDINIVVGDDVDVINEFYVDQLTERLRSLLRDRVTGERLEAALENALDRIPLDQLPTELPEDLRDQLKLELTTALRQRIEAQTAALLERFPSGALPTEVDQSLGLSDFLDLNINNLLWIAGRFELWYEDVGVFTQNSYSQLGVESDERRIDVATDINFFVGEAGLVWRLGTTSLVSTDPESDEPAYPTLSMDLMGGVRYGDASQTVEFDPGPSFDFDADWFAPMVGTRFALTVSDRIAFTLLAETAIITGDNLTENWEIFIGLDWRLSDTFYLRPAYRISSLGLSNDGRLGTSRLNLTAEGLWLGFAFIF